MAISNIQNLHDLAETSLVSYGRHRSQVLQNNIVEATFRHGQAFKDQPCQTGIWPT